MTCSQISPSLRSSPRSQQTRTFYQHRYGKGDIWAGAPFVLHFSTVNMLFQSTSLFASSSPHHVQSSAVIYSMWQAGGSGVVNQPHPHRHVGLKTAAGNLRSCKSVERQGSEIGDNLFTAATSAAQQSLQQQQSQDRVGLQNLRRRFAPWPSPREALTNRQNFSVQGLFSCPEQPNR